MTALGLQHIGYPYPDESVWITTVRDEAMPTLAWPRWLRCKVESNRWGSDQTDLERIAVNGL